MSDSCIYATYRLDVAAPAAQERAQQLALEQSIEMPLAAVTDARVLAEVVARVESVTEQPDGSHYARLALASETVNDEPGQLMNMLFGNCSLQPDVELIDVDIPAPLAHALGGPHYGIAGVRARTGAHGRPLTCTAIKPIGSTPEALATLCRSFAAAGIDFIKDDHGWANQASASFVQRVQACQGAVREIGGSHTLYAPSLYGHYGQMREQLELARRAGVQAVLIAPMVCGVATFVAIKREFNEVLFMAHPSLSGGRIAPDALLGKLYRLFGADVVVFPNHGGRFAFAYDTCRRIATYNTQPWHGLKPALPTPAGGMSVERVPDMVRDYGRDSMLLIGGGLLSARAQLEERSRAFVEAVAQTESSL